MMFGDIPHIASLLKMQESFGSKSQGQLQSDINDLIKDRSRGSEQLTVDKQKGRDY